MSPTGSHAHNHADPLPGLIAQLRKRHGEAAAAIASGGLTAPDSAHPKADAHPPCAPTCHAFLEHDQPVLAELVRSFLIWEAGSAKAASAVRRIEQSVVDFNELRVCMHDEFIRLLGKTTPRTEERAMRMRAALNDVYLREHGMTLEHLPALGKREAREYLESIEGVPRFVAARTLLLALSGHAAPVDGRIHRALTAAKVVEPDSSPEDAAGQLERRIRAGELLEAYLLLQLHADESAKPDAETDAADAKAAPSPRDPARGRSNGAVKAPATRKRTQTASDAPAKDKPKH